LDIYYYRRLSVSTLTKTLMTFNLTFIAILGVSYLFILFIIAHAVNSGWISKKITNHPFTYVVSLGIFFSAWSYYGVVDLAHQFGYGALAYYLGIGTFFLFAPIIQAPLADLCRRFQLRSIADLLVFRYNSQLVGNIATLFILLSIIPLLIIQIQAVADTLLIITQPLPKTLEEGLSWDQQRDTFALFYCLIIIAFCITFGASYSHHASLMTTMAFDSIVKVIALLIVGTFALYGVFGGLGELDLWLLNNSEFLIQLYNPDSSSSAHTLLLAFIGTGVLMPHIFYMSQTGRSVNEIARTVTWAFPLFLLLMAIPIFPILWAGFKLDVPLSPTYFTLAVPQYANAPVITLISWIGGLSAASGALIVSILSLSTMVLNQWLLPLLSLKNQTDIYAQLRWLRRLIIIVITIASYLLYLALDHEHSLTKLAILAAIQSLQFVPGIIAINYWSGANRYGFYAGLISGSLICLLGLVIPLIFTDFTEVLLIVISQYLPNNTPLWEAITLLSLGVNIFTFVLVSYISPTSKEEQYHADICAEDELSSPFRRILAVNSAVEFKDKLALSIGDDAAVKEVNRALEILGLTEGETRPYSLRLLRTRIRTNLSGLLGHTLASEIIEKHFPYQSPSSNEADEAIDINLMESRLDRMGNKLHGLTADVNRLRLHHRDTLQTLPIAICSLGFDDEVLLWNNAMAVITNIPADEVTGSNLRDLPKPWGQLISSFANDTQTRINKQSIDLKGDKLWFRLHKSSIKEITQQRIEGQVILIEDITDVQLLEQELVHNTRLASIGRLAAGVAHEIGNPVTGIACLAQNLRYDDEEDARVETADAILSQTDRISRIVQSLVTFAHTGRPSTSDFHKVNLNECANEAIHLLSLQTDRKPIEYRNNIDDAACIWGDAQRFIQIFLNLLGNANDASPDFSSITLNSRHHESTLEIDIIDEGSGIPEAYLTQIMDPFFTTKETGEGTGLGLSIVYSIIKEHDGDMLVTSPVALGRGTCFTLQLQLFEEAAHNLDTPANQATD
jgi:PAS domain S-box-containing protein